MWRNLEVELRNSDSRELRLDHRPIQTLFIDDCKLVFAALVAQLATELHLVVSKAAVFVLADER